MRFFIAIIVSLAALFSKLEARVLYENSPNSSYSLVFVYLGEKLPAYLDYTIRQARSFNKDCNIFLIANESALRSFTHLVHKLKKQNVLFVKYEELEKTDAHKAFDTQWAYYSGRHGSNLTAPYWKYTTERFFCIDELMHQYGLTDVIQVECDVMVYFNVQNYLPLLHARYPGIAAPFLNDYVGSVSFTYFANPEAIRDFVEFIPRHLVGQISEPDMYLLASYRNARTDREIDQLPTIPKDYIRDYVLRSTRGDMSFQPWKYWNHIGEWDDSFFDPDCLGILLRTGIWETRQTLFDPEPFLITWEVDEEGRHVPYAHYFHTRYKYRINTLHVAGTGPQIAIFGRFLSIKEGDFPEWRGSKWR